MKQIPLGKTSATPANYAPDLLFPIPRAESRSALGLPGSGAQEPLPFQGEDIWNAWELTWLDPSGKPRVGTACIRVPAKSEFLIESKSLKLYLQSHADCRYANANALQALLRKDLSDAAGENVSVDISTSQDDPVSRIGILPGICIDQSDFLPTAGHPDASILRVAGSGSVCESLHSHLLRSRCPVTDQPDSGSILIDYVGRKIDRASLLEYIVSFRHHNDFHEACIERIFLDIRNVCEPEKLGVYGRYNRRGGIDINPFRSNFEVSVENCRLWRQ